MSDFQFDIRPAVRPGADPGPAPATLIPRAEPAAVDPADIVSERSLDIALRELDAAAKPTAGPIRYDNEVRKALRDAKMMRAYAVRVNRKTGAEEIYNPVVFEKALSQTVNILKNAIKLSRDVIDKTAMENFIAAMYWAVAQESPAAQRRIIDRLTMLGSPMVDMLQNSQRPPIDMQ